MLSAYMRFKYPNVIDAALAASAPIFLTTYTETGWQFFFSEVTKVCMQLYNQLKVIEYFTLHHNSHVAFPNRYFGPTFSLVPINLHSW